MEAATAQVLSDGAFLALAVFVAGVVLVVALLVAVLFERKPKDDSRWSGESQ